MEQLNIDPILSRFYNTVQSHRIGKGVYCRNTRSGDLSPNAYGCADAANILYTMNRFPLDTEERAAHIAAIQSFQDAKTGIFLEPTHSKIHTTAHCTAALELFDARPLYPFHELEQHRQTQGFRSLFEDVDWLHCGRAAHNGAGIYAAFVITGAVDARWTDAYFDFLNSHCDPTTGLWVQEPADARFTKLLQIGDAFHFLFNYTHGKRAFPYPDALIDSCLAAYYNGDMGETFAQNHGFIQMDWVYCLNRASRETTHRFQEVKSVLYRFARDYIGFLSADGADAEEAADDLHHVFGVICCLAELQLALPNKVYSSVPLRLVLDRRPFI